MANSDILELIAEVESIVAQAKAAANDGRVSIKEVLGLLGAVAKLAAHLAKLIG